LRSEFKIAAYAYGKTFRHRWNARRGRALSARRAQHTHRRTRSRRAPRGEINNRTPRLVIGRDTRESGAWIEAALTNGAREADAVCESAGVITTPGVAYLARTLPADAGVVISASHNPYQDNGIKIFAPSGRKIDDETERRIEADIHAATSAPEAQEAKDSSTNSSTPIDAGSDDKQAAAFRECYLDYLAQEVGADLSLENLKLVLDCANGAAFQLAPDLFQRLGASVTAINNMPDGRNINLDCGSLHIEGLRRKVVESGADLGVALTATQTARSLSMRAVNSLTAMQRCGRCPAIYKSAENSRATQSSRR
jgi:phosphoglucosamine mutase